MLFDPATMCYEKVTDRLQDFKILYLEGKTSRWMKFSVLLQCDFPLLYHT